MWIATWDSLCLSVARSRSLSVSPVPGPLSDVTSPPSPTTSPPSLLVPPVLSVILFVSPPAFHLRSPDLVPHPLPPGPMSPLQCHFGPPYVLSSSASGVVTSQCHLCLSLRTLLHFSLSPLTSLLCSSCVIHMTAPASLCFGHPHRLILSLIPISTSPGSPLIRLLQFSHQAACVLQPHFGIGCPWPGDRP